MDKAEINATIERMRDTNALSAWQIAGAFLGTGGDSVDTVEFRDRLLGLLHIANAALDVRDAIDDEYIRLPVDADGVPIHIGDEMDCGEHFGIQEVEGFIHDAVAFTVWDPQPARICTCPAHSTRHYHEPTVEDVLREFAEKIIDSQIPNLHPTYEEAIAEYAQKLQLREANDE